MYVLKLENVGIENKNIGQKAIGLGEMLKAGMPVPGGFVVTKEAFMKFMMAGGLGERIKALLDNLDVSDNKAVESVSRQIRDMIMNSEMPDYIAGEVKNLYEELSVGKEIKELGGAALDFVKAGRTQTFVAVRSSFINGDVPGFGWMLESRLGVQGIEELLNAIKKCWSSLFTPWIICDIKNKGIDMTSMGVVVQKMVDAEKSGVIFTADPITSNTERMVIEATWGYGDSLGFGLVIPDNYVVDKNSGSVLDKKIGKKTWLRKRNEMSGGVIKDAVEKGNVDADVLDQTEIRKLWELARMIEGHYGNLPHNIEWCKEKNRMFLLQISPVQAVKRPEEEERIEGKVLLKGRAVFPGVAKGRVRIVSGLEELNKIEQEDILVTKMTGPDMLFGIKKAAGIITDDGGLTCHAAAVARELNIPCIVGTETATSGLREDQDIIIDANKGAVYQYSSVQAQVDAPSGPEPPDTKHKEIMESVLGGSDKLTVTEVKANIRSSEKAEHAAEHADGIGMLKVEHVIAESGKHPMHMAKTEPEELIRSIVDCIGRVARPFYPKPVWYRAMDMRTDEFRELEGGEEEPRETNPILGWHGIRRVLDEPDVFNCEISAIKRLHDQGLNNIALMLPFVSSIEELRRVKDMIDFPLKLGIMIETPASAMDIEGFCREGLDFVSIGSNDLAQLTLGVDRDNAKVSRLYSEHHPAVVDLIKRVVRVCKKYGVKTSICGEAGSDPRMAEILVRAGIDSISTEAESLEEIRKVVSRAERRILLENMRDKNERRVA